MSSRPEWLKRLAARVPLHLFYSLGSVTERQAMKVTIGTADPALYDKQGVQLAEVLKTKMPPAATVLDFGCGLGRPEKFLAPLCKAVWGVDISAGMVRLARKRHRDLPNVNFQRVSGTDLSAFSADMFDLVFSEAVFMHMDKRHVIRILHEMRRVCKPTGVVYVAFPNLFCPYTFDNYIETSIKSPVLLANRVRYWLPEEVRRVAQAVGLHVVDTEVKSDSRDEQRNCRTDAYHGDYSIWLHASKGQTPLSPERAGG